MSLQDFLDGLTTVLAWFLQAERRGVVGLFVTLAAVFFLGVWIGSILGECNENQRDAAQGVGR